VSVAFFGAPRIYLGLLVLVSFVFGYFLVIIALFKTFAPLEHLGVFRFSSCIEESFLNETPCFSAVTKIHGYQSICFCVVPVAELDNLYNLDIVFLGQGLGSSNLDFSVLI